MELSREDIQEIFDIIIKIFKHENISFHQYIILNDDMNITFKDDIPFKNKTYFIDYIYKQIFFLISNYLPIHKIYNPEPIIIPCKNYDNTITLLYQDEKNTFEIYSFYMLLKLQYDFI